MRVQISLRLEKDLLDEVKKVARHEKKPLTTMLRELISLGLQHKREMRFKNISMSINLFKYMVEELVKHGVTPPLDVITNDVQMYFLWNYGERLENVSHDVLKEGLRGAIIQILGINDVHIETQDKRIILTFSSEFSAHTEWVFKVIRDFIENVLKFKVIGKEISGTKAILIVEK